MFHLRMLSSEQFAALREHFSRSGFTEQAVRQRLDIKPEKPLDLVSICTRPSTNRKVADSLDAIIHLFLLGEALPIAEAASFFPPVVWEALTQSDVILIEASDAAHCLASVALVPVRGLFCAADRWTNIDHSIRPTFRDIVYPAMTKPVTQFLDYTSFDPCEDFLELCAGTAPAALLASKAAKNVWATDITERSLAFARFNAALNGIRNVTFAQGDLFQPVEGRAFDRIAVHPPYMPVLKPAEFFSAGGALGEDVTRRIISELPGKLKPGGRLYCRTLGIDRADRNFEQSARDWLGEKHVDYDVALFVLDNVLPRRFALEHTLNKDGGRAEVAQWEKLFEENGVKELLAVVLVLQRIAEQRPAFTLRRVMRDGTPAAVMEWALGWETAMHMNGTFEALFEAKPVATAGTEVTVRHVVREGQLAAEDFILSLKRPFEVDWKVQPWMALLLPRCDGHTTVGELFEQSKQNGWVLLETPATEFCGLIGNLISGGFLGDRVFSDRLRKQNEEF